MPAILGLANETLLQIVDNVHPDDIVNLSRSCQILKRLAQDTLAQHLARRKKYTKITLYGCHRHQDDPHPINLIAEICKDPKIAYYPRSLNIECCERFAMSGGDEAYNSALDSDSEEEEEGKKDELAMTQSMIDTLESSIVNLMRNSPPYIQLHTGRIQSILKGMREGARGYILGLLLVLLPNLEEVSLTQYSTGADAFLEAIHEVALSYSDSIEPCCRALSKLSKVYLRSPSEEEEHDEPCVSMDFDFFRNFAALPSMKSFVGIGMVNMWSFEWASDLSISGLTSFELQDSAFDDRGLDTLLSSMPSLTSFTYGSGSHACAFGEDFELASHELAMVLQSLLRYSSMNLDTLNIFGDLAIGQPMFTADGECSLRGFQNLKEARLHLALLVKDEDLYYEEHSDCTCDLEDGMGDGMGNGMGRWKHDIPRLVNILPASLESIIIDGTVSLADFKSLLRDFADHAAKRVPKLKKVIFLQAEVDESDGARMEAKVWRDDLKAVGVTLEVPWPEA